MPPLNDSFADAVDLAGSSGSLTGQSNVDATTEVGEPAPYNGPGGRSIWYRITPADACAITVDTLGSPTSLDTTVDVFIGSAIDDLTFVAGNDDSGDDYLSSVTWAAAGEVTYYIRVSGYGVSDVSDQIVVAWDVGLLPPNDDWANATELTGTSGSLTGQTNVAATAEIGEPAPSFGSSLASIWYKITTTGRRTVTVDTFGSLLANGLAPLDSVLSVWTGPSVDDLELVVANDDTSGFNAQVSWTGLPATTYYIRVSDFGSGSDKIIVNWDLGTVVVPRGRVLGWYPMHEGPTPGLNRFGVDLAGLGPPRISGLDGIVSAGPGAVATFNNSGVGSRALSVFTYDAPGALTFVDGLDLTTSDPDRLPTGSPAWTLDHIAAAPSFVAAVRLTPAGTRFSVDLFSVDSTGISVVYLGSEGACGTGDWALDVFGTSDYSGVQTMWTDVDLAVDVDGSVWVFVQRGHTGSLPGFTMAFHISPSGVIDATPADGFYLREDVATGRPSGTALSRVWGGTCIHLDGVGLAPLRFLGDPGDPTVPYLARGFMRCDLANGVSWTLTSSERAEDALGEVAEQGFIPGQGRSGDIAPISEGFQTNLDGTRGPIACTKAGVVVYDDIYASDVQAGTIVNVDAVSREAQPAGAVRLFIEDGDATLRQYAGGSFPGTADTTSTDKAVTLPTPELADPIRTDFLLWENGTRAWVYPEYLTTAHVPDPDEGWVYPPDWDYPNPPDSSDFLFLVEFAGHRRPVVGFIGWR